MRIVRTCKGERVVPTLMAPAEPSGCQQPPPPVAWPINMAAASGMHGGKAAANSGKTILVTILTCRLSKLGTDLSGPSPMWTEKVKGWSKSLGQYKRQRVGPKENEVEWSKWRSLASPLVEKSERNGSPSTPTNTYAFMAEESIIAAT
uniref:Uncharacterized protein n=1 Tax=Oryza barthii TaxID=65489 RepID=A0A0D3GXV3_9ORYZ